MQIRDIDSVRVSAMSSTPSTEMYTHVQSIPTLFNLPDTKDGIQTSHCLHVTGRAWVHNFHEKAKQASEAGFKGIEIFYEDLEYVVKSHAGGHRQEGSETPDEEFLLSAAREIRETYDRVGMMIIAMKPFLFYEGLLDRDEHKAKIRKLKTWFRIVKILGTDIIQIPSNFQPQGISGDMDLIVQDMTEIADLGLQESPPVRFAYENLA
jgi:4-hydroxyphenylpyruvate dioxygenase